MGTARTMVSRE